MKNNVRISSKEDLKKHLNIERPENPSPNCWGFKEYGDPKWNPLGNKQMGVRTHNKKKSIINEFLKTYLNTPHIPSL